MHNLKECKGCDLNCLLKLFGKRWTLLIFDTISKNGATFNQLYISTDRRISPILLSTRIKELYNSGLISKAVDGNKYELTALGKGFRMQLVRFRRWCKENGHRIPERCAIRL